MKVLFISNDKAIFTPGSSVRVRMREYAKTIEELHILGRAPQRVSEVDGSLSLHGYPEPALLALMRFPSLARALIHKHQIEIVSAQDPFEYGWVARKAVAGTTAKLHIQIHTDFLSPWFVRGSVATSLINSIRLRLADDILPQAHGIRVVSHRIFDSLRRRYADRIVEPTVLPIVPPSVLPEKHTLPAHPFSFVLMAVCRLEEEKRVDDLFQALFRVEQRYPGTGLMIIGDGRLKRTLMKKAATCCKPHSVQFLGWRDDSLSLMQSAHAFVQASAYEGYGRTLVEAALARIPIITSDVGIVGEVFTPKEDVLAFAPGDVDALAQNIMTIIEDERLRLMLPMQAEQKAKEHIAAFSDQPKRIAEELAEVLKRA